MVLLPVAHRTAKQLRERWHNHLDPGINKGPWTEAEDKLLIVAQNMLGNRFAEIAKLVRFRIVHLQHWPSALSCMNAH